MRTRSFALSLVVAMWSLVIPGSLLAQEASDEGAMLKVGGSVKADDRVSTTRHSDLTFQEYRLELKLDARPTEKALVYAEAWLRVLGTSADVNNSLDLFSKDKVSPYNLDFRQAYFQLNGFILDNIDLKVGRQRIAWGRADKFNPTDNINPYDLEDMWDFGRHLGSDAAQLSAYMGDWKLTGVFVPAFTPAVLPRGDWLRALMPASSPLPAGLTIGQTSDAIGLPKSTLGDSMTLAAKMDGKVLGYDLSLSYLWGRDSLPLINAITLTPGALPAIDVHTDLMYPRRHVIGADVAGSIGPVGVWAEAALFIPEKVTVRTDATGLGGPVQESTALSNKPYVKVVVGADYTFTYDIYLNVQYLHGFFNERGGDNLEDYFVANVDWKLLDGALKLTPISMIWEIKDWHNVSDSWGFAYAPKITYYPVDNAEIALGYHWLEGKETTLFGKLKNNNEVCVNAKYSF